jgi:hypothetical protein
MGYFTLKFQDLVFAILPIEITNILTFVWFEKKRQKMEWLLLSRDSPLSTVRIIKRKKFSPILAWNTESWAGMNLTLEKKTDLDFTFLHLNQRIHYSMTKIGCCSLDFHNILLYYYFTKMFCFIILRELGLDISNKIHCNFFC